MSSSHILVGSEETLSTSQPSLPTFTHQPRSAQAAGVILSPGSTALIVVSLSLITLAVFAVVINRLRKRWSSKVLDERPSEKGAKQDVESLAANRPIIPVTPLPDVRWAPQIRSISGPAPEEKGGRKSAGLPPKRARSPPPPHVAKPRNPFPEPHPKSAPAHALSFDDVLHQTRSSGGELSPPVTPYAFAVSGTETRSLGRAGLGSKT